MSFQIFFSSERLGTAITFVHDLPVTGGNVSVQIFLQSENFVASFTIIDSQGTANLLHYRIDFPGFIMFASNTFLRVFKFFKFLGYFLCSLSS